MRPVGIPKNRISNGEDGRVLSWILTSTGETNPNVSHVWIDTALWVDSYIWTEEPIIYRFLLTHTGSMFSGIEYAWDDSKQWLDGLIWTD